MKTGKFYELGLNPITMCVDSRKQDSIIESNQRGAIRNRIKKSIESYAKK